ncbi:MAG: carbohydrate ABC transporter permease [Anaerolineaceae bacterium]
MSTSPEQKNYKFQNTWPVVMKYMILLVGVVVVLTPVVMILFGSLKSRGEFMSMPYSPPIPPRWENFGKILVMDSFWQMLLNSLIVMAATTTAVVFLCSLTAFVFSRMEFKGKTLAFNFFTLGLMFPIEVAILPAYLVIRQFDLPNTLLAVILVQTAFALSVNIMILRGFFASIPFELQDAAYLDGCDSFGFFWRILLPLAKPALSAVAALTMIKSWNDLLVPLVMLDTDKKWTLPLGTMQFQGQYGQDLAMIATFVTLSAIPAVVFYFFAEKQIVSGLTAGALKG